MLSLMAFLVKWCFYAHYSPHFLSCLSQEYWGVSIVVYRIFLATLIALISKDVSVIPSVIWSEVWPSYQVLLFRYTSLVKELGSCRSSVDHIAFLEKQYPSRAKWLSMVCDILVVFLEESPCCHMTVLSSSWVSGFFELLLPPRNYAGYPRLVGWA